MARARTKPQLNLFGAAALEPGASSAPVDEPIVLPPSIQRAALLSECGRYRYLLSRTWSDAPLALFVLLNPSTADASVDDQTVRKCIGFSRSWNLGGFNIVNLFALRATDPKDLWEARWDHRVGPETDAHITAAIAAAGGDLVVGWGRLEPPAKNRELVRARVQHVLELINDVGRQPMCLGTNADGSPRHPLYLPATTKLEPYDGGKHGRISDEQDDD